MEIDNDDQQMLVIFDVCWFGQCAKRYVLHTLFFLVGDVAFTRVSFDGSAGIELSL